MPLNAIACPVGPLQAAAARDEFGVLLLPFGVAHQGQVDVVGRERSVERPREVRERVSRGAL
jgi:hypothetical protein